MRGLIRARIVATLLAGAALAAPLVSPTQAQAEMIPLSDDRLLVEADLVGLSPALLRIARNEIFARRGYIFNSSDLRAHFSQYAWYRPFTKSVSLNAVEQANVAFIKRYETSPRLQANLRVIPQPVPVQPAPQTTIIVESQQSPTQTAELAEAQAAIEDLAAQIASLEALLTHQRGKTRENESEGESPSIHDLAEAEVLKMLEGLRADVTTQTQEAAKTYQTSIKPQIDHTAKSPRDLARSFPKIPWYDPQYADQMGEFWLESRVSDDGRLMYDLKFLEPEHTTQNVASEFTLMPEDAEILLAALAKTHDWAETARANNIRDLFRKTVNCTPAPACAEKVPGNTSTQIDFVVFEQGATGARLIRNKGAFKEEYGLSISSAALLAAYFEFVLDLGKSTFDAGTRTAEELDKLFD